MIARKIKRQRGLDMFLKHNLVNYVSNVDFPRCRSDICQNLADSPKPADSHTTTNSLHHLNIIISRISYHNKTCKPI